MAPIASVSLGAAREFRLRHIATRSKQRGGISVHLQYENMIKTLEHGSLLVMRYPTNEAWLHSLPIRRHITMPRINLTFRLIKST